MGSSSALKRDEYQAFCESLREAREKSGMSQDAIGRAIGKSQRFVSQCETGKRRVDVVEFRDLCKAFGRAPSSFLAGFPEPAAV